MGFPLDAAKFHYHRWNPSLVMRLLGCPAQPCAAHIPEGRGRQQLDLQPSPLDWLPVGMGGQ